MDLGPRSDRLCTSASDAPCACERGARFQPDESVPGSKCIWRTGHRLDGKTATVDVGKDITSEEHQVRVAPVNPEGDLSSAVRISELYTSEAILIVTLTELMMSGWGAASCCPEAELI